MEISSKPSTDQPKIDPELRVLEYIWHKFSVPERLSYGRVWVWSLTRTQTELIQRLSFRDFNIKVHKT